MPERSLVAVVAFFVFVGITLGLSFYLGRKAKSTAGYFAAHGQIPWFINGIAFAGDYLSAASFLGICGMIAFFGYDGFLYSIGYLAGWVVALFVIAEPMKRLGRFTFADALNSTFQSRGITLAAGVSTLVVSIFYLIPQMVGAGALIQPLLGFPHWVGVVLVGTVVIYIVVSAGMVSTTWVQFLKGSLLVAFSFALTLLILSQGIRDSSDAFEVTEPMPRAGLDQYLRNRADVQEVLPPTGGWAEAPYVRARLKPGGEELRTWRVEALEEDRVRLLEAQTITTSAAGDVLINGLPRGRETETGARGVLRPVGIVDLPGEADATGPLGPLEFLRVVGASRVTLWGEDTIREADGGRTVVYYQRPTEGREVLLPGRSPSFAGLRSGRTLDKVNFISLMLALFCGTASLPHILIRYYTVKDEASARKSTIVGIAAIGFFYILTLYIGLGAMVSRALDVTDSNMAAPLLARSANEWLFAMISAIAFTTVLGTVSGLILASAGAVTHDLVSHALGVQLTDHEKVRIAKLSSIVVGGIAIVLGILFQKLNVSYLVGWAFSIAASANLPSLVMLLFWKGTTRQGVIAAVTVGMVSSLGWILLSADTFKSVYGLPGHPGYVPFSQPGIVTIPLGFLTLILASLATARPRAPDEATV